MSKPRGILPDPAGLFGLILFLALFGLAGSKALQDADTLWHIKAGQVILQQGSLLTTDIFSHTVFGLDWTSHEWLAEIAMALCHNAAGLPGVVLASFVLVGLSFTLLFLAARRVANDWSALFAMAMTAPLIYSHLLARPHLFTWLLGAMTLYLLIRNDRWLWLLPFATAIWSNLHGGVLIGLLLQGVFLCGHLFDNWPGRSVNHWHHWWATVRRPAYVMLLSLLALGCNPFGYSLLWFPFHVSSAVFSSWINEWKSPNFQVFWYARLWIIALVALAAWYGLRSKWTWRLLVMLMLYMALGHIRHMSIAAMLLVPWTAMALQTIPLRLPTRLRPEENADQLVLSPWSGPFAILALGTLLFVISSFSPAWWQPFAEARFKVPEHFSGEAVRFLEQGYPNGNLLNEYSLGGYLLYALDPPPKVFIDGRADMYGERVFSDYVTLTQLNPETEKILRKYDIDWTFFPTEHRLTHYLAGKPGWKESYRDEHVTIMVRDRSGKP
jgi:hypothetical protein